jgi:hypothetical protein
MFATVGAPDSSPVPELKLAHAGGFRMAKVNGLPAGSLAVGTKSYVEPATTLVGGLPLIVGGAVLAAEATVIVNAGSDAFSVPLLTLMVMFA